MLLAPVSVGCLPSIASDISIAGNRENIVHCDFCQCLRSRLTFKVVAAILPVVMLLEPVSVGCFPSIAVWRYYIRRYSVYPKQSRLMHWLFPSWCYLSCERRLLPSIAILTLLSGMFSIRKRSRWCIDCSRRDVTWTCESGVASVDRNLTSVPGDRENITFTITFPVHNRSVVFKLVAFILSVVMSLKLVSVGCFHR
jgi:hypothetical protein